MTDYFTADMHNNHKNVIKYCNRPFFDLEGMRRELVRRWNKKVTNEDRVWILGDIWDPSILSDLKGKIVVIIGNHDSYNRIHSMYPDIEVIRYPVLLYKKLLLSHAPIVEEIEDTDILNIHGHLHTVRVYEGSWWEGNRWFNCGVDLNNFTPVSLDDIRREMGVWDVF